MRDTEAADADSAADGVDAVVVVTEWDEFRALDLDTLKARMRGRVLVDLRNVFDPDAMLAAGLDYSSVGRPRH